MTFTEKLCFYLGAFVAAGVMALLHFLAPDSLHWWTPLLWLGIWTAIECITYFGTRALVRHLARNRKEKA